MAKTFVTVVSLVSVAVVLAPQPARAQAYEMVGVRAQGMGGAFVAVADDATAAWWNPAGLAHGAYFSAILELETSRQPDDERDTLGRPAPAWRSRVRGFSVSFPALALSYYRLRISQIQPVNSIAGGAGGRQDPGTGDVRLRSLGMSQLGVTVGQSVGEHLVLASTIKLVRGGVGAAAGSGGQATLDAADGLDGSGTTRGDLDVGALVVFGRVRLGMAVKNVTRPVFGDGDDRVELPREVRAGVAVRASGNRRIGEVTVAMDADVTRTPTVTGDERRVAAGVEAWAPGRRLGFRGGVSADTIGDARPSASGGMSLALRSGTFLDAHRTVGSDLSRQGWGFAIRMTL